MNKYLISILIILVSIIIYIIIKDKIKALNLIGILTVISGVIIITLTFIIKVIINNLIKEINISTLLNYIFIKFIYTSIIICLLGITEITISKYIAILNPKSKI